MKVGVITFHNVLNYGAVLQTYALQKKMRDLGIESAVIDYNSPFFISNIVKPKIFRYKNPFHYLEDKRFYKKSCIKQAKIKRFSGKFIEKTERIDFESLTDISKQFDYIVTGSDQVWNEKVIKGDYSFFLNFVPPQKRCAYAASIGAKRFLPENLPVIRGLLKEYKAISVREETAKKALKQQMNIESVRVLDPTLLLDKNQYNELICPSKKTNQKYILLYLLNYSKTLVQSAKRLSKKLGIPVFCINPTKKRIYGVEDYSSSGICEFLELISKAEFVITNSFHGVAFSINYNKQFNVELMPSAIDVNSRITDLLDVLNVKNRIISDGKYNLKHFDYGETNQLLEIEREKSVNFIKSMVYDESLTKKSDISVASVPHDRCPGCGLCSTICPVTAIKMVEMEHGFYYPSIDFDACISCGKCLEKCMAYSSRETVSQKAPIKMFAAYSTSPEVVYNSTSGGMFYELAKNVLDKGGVVYGAAFDSEYTLRHVRVEALSDIAPLMGSKYTQSNAFEVFNRVLYDLSNGNNVLFVGTPCQVQALREKCKNHLDKLLLVDFICHGVPSPRMIKKHISYVENYFKKKVVSYKPRSKIIPIVSKEARWGYSDLFTFSDGTKEYLHPISQAYKQMFYRNFGIRESCANCAFTNFNRPGDLTLSDYWGLEIKRPDLVRNEGVSMVLCNTLWGLRAIEDLTSVSLTETSVDTIFESKQPHLFKPTELNSRNKEFWGDFDQKSWRSIVQKYVGCSRKYIIKWSIKRLLKRG